MCVIVFDTASELTFLIRGSGVGAIVCAIVFDTSSELTFLIRGSGVCVIVFDTASE